jgi:CIC family chloride channel protein
VGRAPRDSAHQPPQQPGDLGADPLQLAAVSGREAEQEGFPLTGQRQMDLTAVGVAAAALEEPALGQAVDQADGAVMADLEMLGERADRYRAPPRQAAHGQEGLVLLGSQPHLTGGFLAEMEEAPQRVAKLGQGLDLGVAYRLHTASGDQAARSGRLVRCIAMRYIPLAMSRRSSASLHRRARLDPGTGFRLGFVSLLAAAVGLGAGFAAYALYLLIGLVTNAIFYRRLDTGLPGLQNHTLGGWVVLVPVLGGLAVGLMAKYGSRKIRGHGIPEAMEAVLENQSRIAPRVALLKPLSAAVSIGTGGPFGAEGPIIQTGGALGSLLGQLLHVTAAERKVLLASGAAAGMAATFSTPIAAVVLALELLLFEFKSRSFIPLAIASALATTVHFRLMGRGPMFEVAAVDFGIPHALPYYAVLGLLCGLLATGFSRALYWVEDLYERLPFDDMWWPAIGGLGLGILGFFVPRILGVGYDTLSDILNGRLPLAILLLVLVAKSLALLVSLGSGTSGGLLAPMFTAGAALGGAFALAVDQLVPGAHLSPGACALVGMAAVFAAASRATFAFILFAFEITRDYNAVLPLMVVSVLADLVALGLMRHSIMTEKLARRGLHVQQDYEVDPLHQVRVGEVMERDPPTLPARQSVTELADRIARHDPLLAHHQAFPILDADGRLAGIVTRGDVVRALEAAPEGGATVLEAGSDDLVVAFPEETVHDALLRLLAHDVGRLPVVDRADPRKLVGYLSRASILEARLPRLAEEGVRQPGWLGWAR